MLVSNSGPDAASRAAFRFLKECLPDASSVEGSAELDISSTSEQPQLRSAQVVEGSVLRAKKVPDVTRAMTSGFGAFLDGGQKVRIIARDVGVPLVLGTTSAAVRVRVNRRLVTWGHKPPKWEQKLYVPLRYLSPQFEARRASAEKQYGRWPIVDTSTPDSSGAYPSEHPSVLLERAIRSVDRHREALEDELAEAWCVRGEAPLFIDGGISHSAHVASSEHAIGVIKSHRTLYVEGEALRTVVSLGKGERSSVFLVSPRTRSAVMSWYLRLRDPAGRDVLWGLVRVEMAKCANPTERADEISRWVLAETSPLALPDGRWDKMSYGIRDCEEFLRAIS